ESRAVIGGGADNGEPCRVIDTLTLRQGFERDKTLIVIHGEDCIEMSVAAACKEGIGAVGAVHYVTLLLQLLYRRADNCLLFCAYLSVITCMRIEAEDGNLWFVNTEVLYKSFTK